MRTVKKPLIIAFLIMAFASTLLQVPFASSMEQEDIADKSFAFIKDVALIDVSKYNVSHTDVNSHYLPTQGNIPTQTIKYTLNSTESEIGIVFRFLNGTFNSYHLYTYKGSPIQLQKSEAIIDEIKGTFEHFKNTSEISYPKEMSDMLNSITTSTKNLTDIPNKLKLVAKVQEDNATIRCFYSENGIDYTRKGISMTFENGILTEFGNEWNIYSIGDAVPAISREEALKAAIDAANNYTLSIIIGPDNTLENVPFEIDPEHIDIELNPIEREPLTLQLMWSSRLYFKEPVHFVYCIVVQQWADTGDIKYVAPVSGGGGSLEPESTQPTKTTNQNSQMSTQLPLIAAVAGSIIATFAITIGILKKRKHN